MFQLPHPQRIAEISSLIMSQKSAEPTLFLWDRRHVERRVKTELGKIGYYSRKITPTMLTAEPALFDAYSIYRAYNQLNEACNKLWGTVEIANVVSPKIWKKTYPPFGELFDGSFLGGSLIPTLHYAELSAIISILSSFGCVSVCDDLLNISYNLIRTKNNWYIFERGDYLNKVFGVVTRGWHSQVIKLAEGFSKQISDFPAVDLKKADDLRELRNETDYEILASVGARAIMKLDDYLDFLPLVVDTIKKGFLVLRQICGGEMIQKRPLSSLCIRTEKLLSNLPKLYDSYGKRLPSSSITSLT